MTRQRHSGQPSRATANSRSRRHPSQTRPSQHPPETPRSKPARGKRATSSTRPEIAARSQPLLPVNPVWLFVQFDGNRGRQQWKTEEDRCCCPADSPTVVVLVLVVVVVTIIVDKHHISLRPKFSPSLQARNAQMVLERQDYSEVLRSIKQVKEGRPQKKCIRNMSHLRCSMSKPS